MKRIYALLIIIALFLTGCAGNVGGLNESSMPDPAHFSVIKELKMKEGVNPYIMDYTSEGVLFFIQQDKKAGAEEQFRNNLFYTSFDDNESIEICNIEGIIKSVSIVSKRNETLFDILSISDKATIKEYDKKGNLVKEIILPDEFNDIKSFPLFRAYITNGYILSLENELYIINDDGEVTGLYKTGGYVGSIITALDNKAFVYYKDGQNYIAETGEKGLGDRIPLPDETEGVYALGDDNFAAFSSGKIYRLDSKGNTEIISDLSRDDILSSQIRFIFEEENGLNLILEEISGDSVTIKLLSPEKNSQELNGIQESDNTFQTGSEDEERYHDGRRIIRVAVPSEYRWQIEFHGKKFNTESDSYHVEIDRFEGTLQDYIGKGNRPDVIMMEDMTEIVTFSEKGILEDLIPLFDAQDEYKKEDILPKAVDLLGSDGHLYAMTGRFTLLLRATDGTEYDSNGKCTATEYLNWYDEYLVKNDIDGMGSVSDIIYADIDSFYDEGTATADFESGDFKALMETYKRVLQSHKGELDRMLAASKGWGVMRIAQGPLRYPNWVALELTDPSVSVSGLPTKNGESAVIMDVHYPLGIMNTSECPEGAFDFIMYYSNLDEYLVKGSRESDYGKAASTPALFSTNINILERGIYNTEKPFTFLMNDNGELVEYCYTAGQKEVLKNLIDSAEGDTRTRRIIYDMLEEEMDGFINGNKELDDCCKALQSRAVLFLEERQM